VSSLIRSNTAAFQLKVGGQGGTSTTASFLAWPRQPVYSGQKHPSSGMAEAFVKTFKRDYVYVHDRPDASPGMV